MYGGDAVCWTRSVLYGQYTGLYIFSGQLNGGGGDVGRLRPLLGMPLVRYGSGSNVSRQAHIACPEPPQIADSDGKRAYGS